VGVSCLIFYNLIMAKTYKGKSMRLGGGGRSAKLADIFARQGISNPGGLIGKIGRAKYGKKKFQAMAAKGRKRKHG
jgi:hypothetical protein